MINNTEIHSNNSQQKVLEKMKKSTFGLLATAAMILTPVAAFAQDSQSNLQINRSNAAAVGVGNFVNQNTTQQSYQDQFDINGYHSPSSQNSIQDNASNASAVGEYNVINQGASQYSGQTNTDINTYSDYYGY